VDKCLQHITVVNNFNEKYLSDILMLEKECFPKEWQYPDAVEYYRKMLSDKNNIHILWTHNQNTIGYLLAKPHNNALEDLTLYDQEMTNDSDRIYLETIQILPLYRGKGGMKKLIFGMCHEANKREIYMFSIHARTINNFNLKIKKLFNGMITKVRTIKSWKYGGEAIRIY
jgi:ribosomal protein S18 acetylase RimI-like enzyme